MPFFQPLQKIIALALFAHLTPALSPARGEGSFVSRSATVESWVRRANVLSTLFGVALLFFSALGTAEELACVTTEWKLLGANHKVCVESFSDPQIAGVTCHVSQARKGGVKGTIGVAEDPSQFSLSCRQTGPITLPAKLAKETTVFSADTSLLFKETRVIRLWDEAHNTLVYLAISRKVIDGAPANSVSTVPVMPWGGR